MPESTANKNILVVTGIIGLLAAVLVGWGEFLLNFDNLARYSQTNYDFMPGNSNASFRNGHFIGVLAAPLYLAGCWHIYLMLRPADQKWAMAAFFISAGMRLSVTTAALFSMTWYRALG